MGIIDINCLLGNWPFRKIRKNKFEDLKAVHKRNEIDYGYVSSLNSIFIMTPLKETLSFMRLLKIHPINIY